MTIDDDDIPEECEDYESQLLHTITNAYKEKHIGKELAWCLLELNRNIECLEQKIRWIMDWVPAKDKKFLPKEGENPFFSSKDILYDYEGAKERMKQYKERQKTQNKEDI